jgi:putative copper export protein
MMLEVLAAAIKFVLYAGALTGAGTAFAAASLGSRLQDASRSAPKLIAVGAGLTLAAAIGNLLILIMRLGGSFDEPTLSAIAETPTSTAAALQIAGALGLLAFCGLGGLGWLLRIVAGAAVIASFAVNGHASSVDLLASVIAFVHVFAASWWSGALLLLSIACARLPAQPLSELVHVFSRFAMAFVGNLIAAGILLILSLVDFSRPDWLSPYAQLLAVKVALAAGVLGLATYNKLRLTPRLSNGDSAAIGALRRSIQAELLVIAGVLTATAILTTYTSPHT